MKIIARCPKTLKILDLEFTSIEEAKKHNPHLIDFAINVMQVNYHALKDVASYDGKNVKVP